MALLIKSFTCISISHSHYSTIHFKSIYGTSQHIIQAKKDHKALLNMPSVA